VTVVRDHAWIAYRGVTYEVGEDLWERFGDEGDSPETLRDAGVDPLDWVEDVERAGKEDVAGTPATKLTARLDGDRLLRDVNKLSAEPEAPLPFDVDAYVDDSRLEAWIGHDGIWRRVTVKDDFEVPAEQRDAAGGADGGRLSLDVRLDDPNEPVEIEGPADARPIDELLRRLGIPPELLLGPGFAEPSPG
jgi:hypothetical protein